MAPASLLVFAQQEGMLHELSHAFDALAGTSGQQTPQKEVCSLCVAFAGVQHAAGGPIPLLSPAVLRQQARLARPWVRRLRRSARPTTAGLLPRTPEDTATPSSALRRGRHVSLHLERVHGTHTHLAAVLAAAQRAGVTKIGIAGNEQFERP